VEETTCFEVAKLKIRREVGAPIILLLPSMPAHAEREP
jgi:hypothetical protein